ncbi:Peptidoglycan/LPS O-acetylase OafA/YrhL, contains acyltransferase and SGNH-hydrolase domains [Chryseobacterium taichungense]|uniref:Peptidoglycan/LPS O-acetylase OafA/YrhL, contains acyltransferase and SGNH-hydrolase domains n=1 Tax=Chryseobacterium taichungense TaxID=295069 RepID=A0A1H7W5Z6_9FLAO|nr:acyltransferase [Chryseobacterium taichungense]SEM17012.1 Peptidoglycan/LPS O-acetylase OafA/YrhL, contains acyltransferase and SGNH-hydrolase domains [Chryseobacterium taichungense]
MKLTYYKNLDGVRAIAALMVMVFHFFQSIEINTPTLSRLSKISIFGQTGVTLFFVLSGFLITRILIFTKSNTDYFKNFYLRRTLRIFPLYYLFLLIFYYAYPFIFKSEFIPIGQQIFYYTYLQNFAITFNWATDGPGHFWSLAVEEQFYLFWPLVVYLFSNKNLYRIIVGIIAGSFILRIIMLMHNYEVFYFTFTRFDSLAIGALLSLLEIRQIFNKRNANKFLLLTVGILAPTLVLWTFVTGEANNIIQAIKYVLLSFTYFALIGYVLSINAGNFVNTILESKFFAYTGKISYGLYVYHPFAYMLSKRFMYTENWILNMIIGFALTYILAALSYHLYESNFLKLKKYFEYSGKKEMIQKKTTTNIV